MRTRLFKLTLRSALSALLFSVSSVSFAQTTAENDVAGFAAIVRKMAKEQSAARPARRTLGANTFTPVDTSPYFDLPVTYNNKVKWWINYFQTGGRKWFKTWLERSHAYLPQMQKVLAKQGMPQDLAYVAMIESGFSSGATSTAEAVGYWQFITPTANRYGLRTTWWLDERRDFSKSTTAASKYLSDLFRQFGSWYLTAAAYNMGEGRTQKLVRRYGTRNYWVLSKRTDFPEETRQYIPKLLAAMLISKAPKLYGFHEVVPQSPDTYDYFSVPGGTDLLNLAHYIGVDSHSLLRLNPELVRGFVPTFVQSHRIRIPRGQQSKVSQFVRAQL
jgi:membrane-bound lytic murein transglycosylase D